MTPIWLESRPVTIVFWLAFAACFLPEMIGARWQASGKADRRHDRWSHPILIVGLVGGATLAFNVSASWPAARIGAGQAAMLLAGTLVMVGGAAFRWYSIRVLGRFFTRDVAIREGHRIVRDGPYRYLRHPSYSGGILSMFGVGLALGNWVSLAVITGAALAVYAYRMKVEEQALSEAFGDSYRAYRRETKRLLPFVY
ncbi:isoprenylcysteine carboxylmethyltransferase family protein [Acidiphilium sp. AL]|uniref:methyltransferase family protein n=1 Tax=Acidiphilium sp. AL TaxID=2871704 RepID=UPI0021CB3712|nr:isoprenylcysteine carboxylmethyltransferase family protein [Acidiphilium sp. AL]MCU4160007.1 isoprenylcysteine carboxylmethyltransferase family protein [Acidiphilium sp. AL]